MEFAPKYGAGSLLYEHHTTSLVFNDPPLHTRVRKLIVGALNRRARSPRWSRDLIALVDRLLDAIAGERQARPDRGFRLRDPDRGDRQSARRARRKSATRCATGRWPSSARWSRSSSPEALGARQDGGRRNSSIYLEGPGRRDRRANARQSGTRRADPADRRASPTTASG